LRLSTITEQFRHPVQAQYLKCRRTLRKKAVAGLDDSTIDESLLREFEALWKDGSSRLLLVPGKDVLSALNAYLQQQFSISLTHARIVDAFHLHEIPSDMVALIKQVDIFGRKSPD
jgi:hypothetical protein